MTHAPPPVLELDVAVPLPLEEAELIDEPLVVVALVVVVELALELVVDVDPELLEELDALELEVPAPPAPPVPVVSSHATTTSPAIRVPAMKYARFIRVPLGKSPAPPEKRA